MLPGFSIEANGGVKSLGLPDSERSADTIRRAECHTGADSVPPTEVPEMNRVYTDDDQRMIRLQDGDPHAFDEIVSTWSGPLFGFLYRSVRDVQLAEDLVQETLLRVFRKAWDYLPTGQFRGWLFRIARNLVIDRARRSRRDALVRRVRVAASATGEEPDLLSLLPGDVVAPHEIASRNELSSIVRRLLEELPDEQQQTFVLHHFESLTLSEVAVIMETSLPTTKSRLRLAREKLRYQLVCRGLVHEEDTVADSVD